MFDTSKIYKMLKPDSNPELITKLPIFIGGTTATPDLLKGAIIVHLLNNKPISSQYKDMLNPDVTLSTEKGSSMVELTYQIDIYKQNGKNVTYIEVEREAITIQEWLKSFEIQEYLQSLNAEILPNYSLVRHLPNIEVNQSFTNRASFDFTIVSINSISEKVTIIENVIIDKTIILQGELTNE